MVSLSHSIGALQSEVDGSHTGGLGRRVIVTVCVKVAVRVHGITVVNDSVSVEVIVAKSVVVK